MSDIIRLLPDSVANQIAAGEVIQRPASVIKELVENAVDAGATEIRIFVRDAGRTLIQVIDNGKGMSVTDARMAFERHATSKISQATDLSSLRTMGFRGEALPSICAVAQIEMKTRTDADSIGTHLIINASRVEMQEPVVCERGTNIMVKNLFFNIPARRKFLKSDNVEAANIMREFERLALVNNNIRMSIDRGGRPLDLRPGSFKQRIGDLWKNNLNMQLLPVEVDTAMVKISGFVSRPEHSRRRNALQYLIVNGRNMRHPYFHRGIISCFENLIPSDSQPCYFLKFDVDPASIDVNVHPTKNEIKFENEQEIWRILTSAIRASLGRNAAVPSIDFTEEIIPIEPLRDGEIPKAPSMEVPGGYNPFERYFNSDVGIGEKKPQNESRRNGVGSQWRPTRQSQNWETLYQSFMNQSEGNDVSLPKEDPIPVVDASETPDAVCMQLAAKYILVPSREGLLIIDQHRAHVRILFEHLMASGGSGETPSQQSLFPDVVNLDEVQCSALEEVKEELETFGFRLEPVAEGKWKITGVPAPLHDADPGSVIIRILSSVCDDSTDYGREGSPIRDIQEKMALVMARSAAIRRGQRLSVAEMEHIVSELFSLSSPALTPEGNPVYKILDESQIEHLF